MAEQTRYSPIEPYVFCLFRILRDGRWYDMKPLSVTVKRAELIYNRLKRKGRSIKVYWSEGMG